MTTEQLKPCPFCNADMSSVVRSAEGFCRSGSTLYVPCDCGAMGPEGKTIDDAIAAWNLRTPVEQLSAQTAEPYGYVLKTGHGTAFRENLAGVEPDFVKHWVRVYTHPAKTELFKNWNTCPGCKAKWKELPENSPLMKAHRELEAREEAELQSGIISISCRPNEQNAVQTEQPSLSNAEILAIADKAGFVSKDAAGSLYFECWKEAVIHFARLLAQRQDSDKEPLVWESTTPCYTRFISEARYQKFSPEVRAWYRPVCQKCGATK